MTKDGFAELNGKKPVNSICIDEEGDISAPCLMCKDLLWDEELSWHCDNTCICQYTLGGKFI